MTKSQVLNAINDFCNDVLSSDDLIDEYEFRNLDISEILDELENYIEDYKEF